MLWGIGHGDWAWGIGHWAWGIGQGFANLKVGAWGILSILLLCFSHSQDSALRTQHSLS
ncbi:hypothetical protein H6F73_07070 [Microcoleus sp. FACHB-68]|nr:hypothetical protein [Microcoleus sp. FACHB-68]